MLSISRKFGLAVRRTGFSVPSWTGAQDDPGALLTVLQLVKIHRNEPYRMNDTLGQSMSACEKFMKNMDVMFDRTERNINATFDRAEKNFDRALDGMQKDTCEIVRTFYIGMASISLSVSVLVYQIHTAGAL